MGYTKAVLSGNTLELFEYETQPLPRKRYARVNEDDFADPGVSPDGVSVKRKQKRDPANAKRASASFRRLLLSNLSGTENPVLVSFTYRENERDLSKAYRDFKSFIEALRYRYGASWKYVCVPEFQRRGAIHFHSLFWGLPKELVLQERQTREIAKLWGQGFVDVVLTDGHRRLAFYLSKYMSKAFLDERLGGKKAYTASRNISRPLRASSLSRNELEVLLDVWGIDLSTSLMEYEKEYNTLWLGRASYKQFKLV